MSDQEGTTGECLPKWRLFRALGTDLEPDDVLALVVLAGRRMQPLFLYVGEGDPRAKYERALTLVRLLGWSLTKVRCGAPSVRVFPGETAPSHSTERWDPEEMFGDLFPTPNASNTVLWLKPPTELLEFVTEEATRGTHPPCWRQRQIDLFLYGSFNFRCVPDRLKGELASVLRGEAFKSVCIYESFGGTSPQLQNLNAGNIPALAAITPAIPVSVSDSPEVATIPDCLGWTCRVWDEAILLDCDETCAQMEELEKTGLATDETRARFERNDVCRKTVRAHDGAMQFVAADPVLAVLMHFDVPLVEEFPAIPDPDPVTYDCTTSPYPTITPLTKAEPSTRTVHMYRGIPVQPVLDAIDTSLCNFLTL